MKVKICQIKLKLSTKLKIVMKNTFKSIIFCLFFIIVFSSCESDDGGSTAPMGLEFAGTWVLTEVTLSAPIDTNDDGTTSANLLDEADCLTDTIVLDESFEWNSNEVVVNLLTQITGNLYNVSCSNPQTQNGNWGVSGSNLFLVGSVNRTFLISGDVLIENLAQDLPGIRTMVYVRQ